MTTTVPAPATRLARAAHDRAVATVRRRSLRVLLVAGVWFWTIWAALVLCLPLIVERWGGQAQGLTYDAAGSPARWPALAVGIIVAGALLSVHLAAGGTRRALVAGIVRGAVVGGLVYGVLAVALTLAEEQVYAALDRPWRAPGALPLDSVPAVVLAVVAAALVIVTYVLVGVGVLAGYRRWGAWRGTLAIVPLLLPGVLVDLATRTGVFGIPLREVPVDSPGDVVVVLAGALVAAALAALVAHRMLAAATPRRS